MTSVFKEVTEWAPNMKEVSTLHQLTSALHESLRGITETGAGAPRGGGVDKGATLSST